MTTMEVTHRSEFLRALLGDLPAGRLGVTFPDDLDYDEWAEIGRRVGSLHSSTAWWIGDWVNYGFWRYGQKYEEAVSATGLDYGTLRNYASVCEAFDLSRRHDKLSFSHHQVIASLDREAQDTWLLRAATEGLSYHALREALQEARAIDPPARTTVTLEQIRFTVPPDRAERWKVAAEKAGQDFSEWASGVLDEAAA